MLQTQLLRLAPLLSIWNDFLLASVDVNMRMHVYAFSRRENKSVLCKSANTSITIKNSSCKWISFNNVAELLKGKLWACSRSVFSYFTFSGDAGGRVGGGGWVPACSTLFAPGCCLGSNRGGKGVEIRGVNDVTHLVLGLKDEKCCQGFVTVRIHAGSPWICSWAAPNTHTYVFQPY